MPLGLILMLCGLGASFLIPGLIIIATFQRKKRNCTEMADGSIIDIKVRSSGDHGMMFYPVYEYDVEGIKYRGTGTSNSSHTFKKNSLVTVMYNPRKPKQSYIKGHDNKSYRILGIVFSVIGCVPLIICICIALLK